MSEIAVPSRSLSPFVESAVFGLAVVAGPGILAFRKVVEKQSSHSNVKKCQKSVGVFITVERSRASTWTELHEEQNTF